MMAEENLKVSEEENSLEKVNDEDDSDQEVWDDRSFCNEENVCNSLPDLERWDDMLKELIPETHSQRKEEPVFQETVVDLKAVKPRPKPPAPEAKPVEPQKSRGITVSDKQLLILIQKYKEADKICEQAQINLQTLQRKVAHLSYRLKKYIDVEGLYRDTGPVKMTQEGILIPKGHLVDTGFKVGDLFNVGFKDNFVMLTRQRK